MLIMPAPGPRSGKKEGLMLMMREAGEREGERVNVSYARLRAQERVFSSVFNSVSLLVKVSYVLRFSLSARLVGD